MTSLWLDRPTPTPAPRSDLDHHVGPLDDVVVGAGITGLVTGLLLARAGRRVAVVEARERGAVTTGHSSAKVSLLQGTQLSRIRRHHTAQVAAAYVEGNRQAQAWLLALCEERGVAVDRRPAVTYAAERSQRAAVRREVRIAQEAGLDVHWRDRVDEHVDHHGAAVLADQAQVDPVAVVDALTEAFLEVGGLLHEGVRVTDVSWDGRTVELADGREVGTSSVVLATGTPVLDRGLGFAKLEPQRSYVVVLENAAPPHAMLLSAGSPSRSLRSVEQGGRSLLMVGGAGHTVGRGGSEQRHLDDLRRWVHLLHPGAVETHAWSAQDYSTTDGVPWVGPLPRGRGRIRVATGFSKWGMTNGVAAALGLAQEILEGVPPRWLRTQRRRLTGPRKAAGDIELNLRVGLAACLAAPGAGRRPLCTHLGGVLRRNDVEGTWDCPLHGSRFAADGSVLEGPATQPLSHR